MSESKSRMLQTCAVELTYAITQNENLAASPVADKLLAAESGRYGEVTRKTLRWSPDALLHRVVLSHEPFSGGEAEEVAARLQQEIRKMNSHLLEHKARLLPTGMHPFMDPVKESVIWPHQDGETFSQLDKLFDYKRHAWANAQSATVILPFQSEEEFAAIHAAVRLILPLLPALASSSPYVEGRETAWHNNRIRFLQDASLRYPQVVGQIIPEAVFSRKDYELAILARIYQDLEEDVTGALRLHEGLNMRGAVALFGKNQLVVKLLDLQECPWLDVALACAVTQTIALLATERLSATKDQRAVSLRELAAGLRHIIVEGPEAEVKAGPWLTALGMKEETVTARGIWAHLFRESNQAGGATSPWSTTAHKVLEHGTLGERIKRACGAEPSRSKLREVYHDLAASLAAGRFFGPSVTSP